MSTTIEQIKTQKEIELENFQAMKDDILRVFDDMEININEITDEHDLYSELDYSGRIHEIIDGMIDIYYYDLRLWSVDNYSYVEQAIEEGLCEGVTDFHKLIQSGQYVYFLEMANEVIEEIYSEKTED